MANMAQQDVTVAQLRAKDYEYAARFGQLVSTSVLDIVEASDQLEVFDYAYQWQMWAAAQARAASFDRDPFAGMLELWTLAGQQRDHFTEGGGKEAFGGQQAIAIHTTERLEREIRELASGVMEPQAFETLSARVDAWVDENPIRGPALRETHGACRPGGVGSQRKARRTQSGRQHRGHLSRPQ